MRGVAPLATPAQPGEAGRGGREEEKRGRKEGREWGGERGGEEGGRRGGRGYTNPLSVLQRGHLTYTIKQMKEVHCDSHIWLTVSLTRLTCGRVSPSPLPLC